MPHVNLEIYVERGCMLCGRSLELADYVRGKYPAVAVRVIDAADEAGERCDLVVATPTYILNGARFSLGNPSRSALERAILSLLQKDRP